MSYIVSARKYRPHTFEDVVGQEQITDTLKRAIEKDHVAQAFLFCGPRGVGKTTCARILAKAVNTGKTEKLDEIEEDFSFNIFELDAASNNKVEDMHQLIAQVRIPPQTGKYKIYIIDEVHMLTTSAFNAFLKTLEEPPPYAIFILATTEKHKILPTILSRCQIYDFRRISVLDIVGHLKNIAAQEKITAEEDALHIIAEKADGALRDALSIFDRLVSFAGNNLTYEAVVKNLNVLDYDYFFKMVDALTTEDVSSAFLLFDEILNNGFEGDHFVIGLAAHLRNLLVCKDEKTLRLLEVSDLLRSRYAAQSNDTPSSFIINGLSLASDCEVQYAQSQNKRLLVELMLIKIAYAARAIKGADLVSDEKKNPIVKRESKSDSVAKPIDSIVETKEAENTTPSSAEDQAVEAKVEEVMDSAEQEESTEQDITETNAEIPKNASAEANVSTSLEFSLEALEKAVEEEVEVVKDTVPTEASVAIVQDLLPLNQDNLLLVWHDLIAEMQEDEDHLSLYEIVEDKQPQLTEKTVQLFVDSAVEQNFVTKNLPYINAYLKSKLEMTNFSFELLVNEVVVKRKHVLNQKDKLDILVKKNPSIQNLKDQLGLELEH